MRYPIYTTLLFVLMACSKNPTGSEQSSKLGELQHDFSISAGAKPYFDQGLLLLHSFEYDDAREAFEQAKEADPNEVMVYWGLAMTHYKALWGLQDLEAGRSVMNELGDTPEARSAACENQLEKDFWEGIEILYGEGELLERNQKYVDHMAAVYEQNPKNLEVAAFYSLGLMWAGYDKQEYLDKSSTVAAGIIKENPTHPGALHYMIHANDNPEFAQVAINAADDYAKVAPDAAHALHMPSHIYVALGMWNEVVSSNTASYEASLKRVARKGLSGKDRGYHSMAWLHYGYLQQGRNDEAADLLAEMIGYYKDSTASESYLIKMQNQQRIEAGYWPENLELQVVDVDQLTIGLEGKSGMYFVKSLLAYDRNDAEAIRTEINELRVHLEAAKLLVTKEGIALCSAGPTRYAPNDESVQRTQVIIYEMEAMAAMVREDPTAVEKQLKKATALETEVGYDPGPPFIAYPSFELYGDWLLTQDRYEEALVQFNQSLESRTNRTKALRGKLVALRALDRTEEAKEVEQLLTQVTPELIAVL